MIRVTVDCIIYLFIYYSLQSKSNKGQVKVTLQGNNVMNLLKSSIGNFIVGKFKKRKLARRSPETMGLTAKRPPHGSSA